MKLAIMQPYFFPYIGYWQLIHAVDKFVIYDDVNYIKGGWINRNRILINGKPVYITVPLHKASPYKRICDIVLQSSQAWRDKLVKMVEITYGKAAYFYEVFPVIEKLIRHEVINLSDYLSHHIQTLASFMDIKTELVTTSRSYHNDHLNGQARLIEICRFERADIYVNPEGGQALYKSDAFRKYGLDLLFLAMRPLPYKQRATGFIPYLSLIDVLMETGPDEVKYHLDAFDLLDSPSNS